MTNKDDRDDVTPLATDTNGRQSDIYARFLEQMKRIDGDAPSGSSQKTRLDDTAYEPLSEEELQMFAEFQEQTAEIAARYDAEHPEEVAAENQPPPTFSRVEADDEAGESDTNNGADACPLMTVEPPEPTPHTLAPKKPPTKTSKHVLRGLMLLAIGLISGVVISAVAIFALDPAVLLGDKDTPAVTASSDAPAAPTPETPEAAAPANTATVASAPEPSNAISDTVSSDAAPQTDTPAAAAQTVSQETPQTANDDADTSPASAVGADPDITYEDFREEAQTTLYRDTSK